MKAINDDDRPKASTVYDDPAVCKFCGAPKEPRQLCCADCYRRLPRHFRVEQIKWRNSVKTWLREHPARPPVSYPQAQVNRELDDALDQDPFNDDSNKVAASGSNPRRDEARTARTRRPSPAGDSDR